MPVRVVGPGRGDRDAWADRVDEGLGRRGLAAVVRDLEQVDPWQALGQQRRVDVLFHVAGQEEPTIADASEEHDRDVVDARTRVRRRRRDATADRPKDRHRQLVDLEAVAGREAEPDRRAGAREALGPRGIPGPRPAHAGLEDAPDAVAVEEQRQAGDVVLVRVAEDDRIDPPVPRWDPMVEVDEEAVGVRAAIDEQAAAA